MNKPSSEMIALEYHPDDLLIFLDETGSEKRIDPNYPIFGYGGCAIMGRDYSSVIDIPWKEFKENHYGGADK